MKKILLIALPFVLLFPLIVPAPVAEGAGKFKFAYSQVTPKVPCQNSTVTYKARIVKNQKPISGINIKFKVYYKTTTTRYSTVKTNKQGVVTKKFRIGRATPNYQVKVVSEAKKNGQIFKDSTTFRPKSC